MKRSVLPQPKRRIQHPLPPPLSLAVYPAAFRAGQAVEVSRGELAGARGVVVRSDGAGRWLVKLDGLPAGAFLSIPRDGLRLIAPSGK